MDKMLAHWLAETFEEVKEAVRKTGKRSRAGLMLGLQELGASLSGFVGGCYHVGSNLIVMNRTPLRRIRDTNPCLFEPYSFHVLLHEYIHRPGLVDESLTRQKTCEISKKTPGVEHIATQLSVNMERFLPDIVYPAYGWMPQTAATQVEIVKGFDKSSAAAYIA